MQTATLTVGSKTITAYLPEHPQTSPLLLTFSNRQESDALAELTGGQAVRAAIDEPVWEHAFTPWPAPRAFRQAPDFGGGADAYLEWIAIDVLPAIEKQFGLNPLWRGMLGYSLAGLFAAYCSYRRFLFNRMAAVSASLWFDGWQWSAAANTPLFLPEYAYFSVGSKEKNAKNPRLAQIETAILATRQNWQAEAARDKWRVFVR
ncbi:MULTISPECIES: alpha/beta hydrolase-fold protein [unclassified Neisseria]|uniref:alpha/beta hydrolase-fold protein n=1 Tax=unclassified Neisseria TaxID=2623750 RepID=UPI001072C657|nr:MULTISPECIES: alpha/beta hydrolase-fold protein [unclassified Neisseria]MBF0802883.1 hypothetical protein [Neisseria sp. 19428wB4_WF04]TFU44422.1 hypothetical protein E4T99_00620 [Neisseria sp. WF04]